MLASLCLDGVISVVLASDLVLEILVHLITLDGDLVSVSELGLHGTHLLKVLIALVLEYLLLHLSLHQCALSVSEAFLVLILAVAGHVVLPGHLEVVVFLVRVANIVQIIQVFV